MPFETGPVIRPVALRENRRRPPHMEGGLLRRCLSRLGRGIGIAGCLGVLAAGPAAAQANVSGRTPQACAAITDDADRLACFDALFPRQMPAGAEPGAWALRIETSMLANRPNVYLDVKSRETVPADYGTPERARLRVQCVENTTSVLFRLAGNYMSDYGEAGLIRYRIDDQPAQSVRGNATRDNLAIGLTTGSAAIPFVRRLFSASSLLVEVQPVNKSNAPVTLTFPVAGLEQAIAPLRKACHW